MHKQYSTKVAFKDPKTQRWGDQVLLFFFRLEYFNVMGIKCKNKTNHPISSNSHPSATRNKAIHCLKWGGGGGYKTNGNIR